MINKINIAIDGPSGAGKSSIAKIIAEKLDLVFINTGLMYRALGYYCLKNNVNLDNENDVLNCIKDVKIELLSDESIKIDNLDITQNLWDDEISISASKIAKLKLVREFCVKKQQELAKIKPGVVMEGRDIGSVVLKDAHLKIFLTASNEQRVNRRIEQLRKKGKLVDREEVLKNIIDRDKRDIERENNPLIKVEDAIEIDTSFLSLEQVVELILKLAKEKMK